MAHSRQQSEWARTASIIAKIHNVNCTNARDMISPADIMPNTGKPRVKRPAPPPTAEERAALRKAFPGKRA